jgi:hypothetical protein
MTLPVVRSEAQALVKRSNVAYASACNNVRGLGLREKSNVASASTWNQVRGQGLKCGQCQMVVEGYCI